MMESGNGLILLMKTIPSNSCTQITNKPLDLAGPSDGGRVVSEVDIEKIKMLKEQIKMDLAVLSEDYEYLQEAVEDVNEHLTETESRLEGRI
tara:strand:+ start:172 stop:447 length:276 start_codon:yes stop_codon:yes gene_type:complete